MVETKTRSRKVAVTSTVVGCLLAGMLLEFSLLFHDSILPPPPSTSAVEERIGIQLNNNPASMGEGWHPIHVFYGNRSALLEGSPKPNRMWFSQVGQDRAVVELLGDDGSGGRYFIDLAANHPWFLSNTLALEKRGWNGLCIEPNPMYWYGLSHRKCTVVGALVGGKVEQVNVSFRGAYGGIVGLMDNSEAIRSNAPDAAAELRYTAPLAQVFEQFQVPKVIDYMSLDVEGAEFLIMKHFPFDQFIVKLMTVERPSGRLRRVLGRNGYVFLRKISTWGEMLFAHNSTGLTAESLQNWTLKRLK